MMDKNNVPITKDEPTIYINSKFSVKKSIHKCFYIQGL